MNRRLVDLRERRGRAPAARGRGLRRLAFWVLATGGLLVLLLVLGAVAIGVWLLVNADAAIAWVNGVINQLGPILSIFTPRTGGG